VKGGLLYYVFENKILKQKGMKMGNLAVRNFMICTVHLIKSGLLNQDLYVSDM